MNKQILKEHQAKQLATLTDYAFDRVSHKGTISVDSVRRVLNQHEIEGVSEAVLAEMLRMSGESKEDFTKLFESLKFKADAEGRIK